MHKVQKSIEPEAFLPDGRLTFMLGEELKKPLITIQALAERSSDTAIQSESRRALRTIDNILYLQQVSAGQQQLNLTTVHAGSALAQVAGSLRSLSIEHGCETEVDIQSGIPPVHADSRVLRCGLESLWQAVIAMTERPSAVAWKVYRTNKGIRVVVTNNSMNLDKMTLSRFNNIAGKTRQPIVGVSGPATDLLTAQGLFGLLGTKLIKVSKTGTSGLAVTLPISKQLALV